MPRKGSPHVLEPRATVVTHLRRRGPDPDELARGLPENEPRSQLAGEKLSLVEPALAQSVPVQGHRQRPRSREALDHEPFGQQEGQGPGQAPPAFVLEALHCQLDRSLVGHGRAKAGERPQPLPAATASAHGVHFRTTPPAGRLFEVPDAFTAPIAQPRAHPAAATASRREHEVRKAREHRPRLRTGSRRSLHV